MVMSGEKRADGRENLIDAHPIESRLDRHFYFFHRSTRPTSKKYKVGQNDLDLAKNLGISILKTRFRVHLLQLFREQRSLN